MDTVAVADFTVAGYTIDSAEVVGENEEDSTENQHLNEYVLLTLTEDLTKNARPSVSVSGVSRTWPVTAINTTTRTSDNTIKATLTVVSFSALVAEKGEQAIGFTSDEALRSKSGDKSRPRRRLTVTRPWPSRWPTTPWAAPPPSSRARARSRTSRAYGVMIQAVDVDGNMRPVWVV